MGLFSGISEVYKRMRHTKGFGVHSPLGYAFVKTVISPGKESYYGYETIRRAFLESHDRYSHKERRMAELILRMAVFVKARSVYLPEWVSPLVMIAVGESDSRMSYVTSTAEISDAELVILGESDLAEIVADALPLRGDQSLFLCGTGDEPAEILFRRIKGGIWFHGKRNSVILIRDHMMDKVEYTVNL